MPLDASIPLSVRPPETQSPLALIGGLLQMKESQARQSLQAQQIRASQAAVADQEQQTQQRERQNQSLATVTDILKDPIHAAAVGKGDVSELQRRGVDPTIVQKVQEGVLVNQKNQAALDSDKLKLNAEHHTAIGKAMDGILASYADQPDLLPSVYAGTLNNLIAEGHLNKGTFPDTIKDAADIKNLLAVNGYQANINEAALARKGTQQKIDSEAAQATSDLANANNKNVLTPIEAAGKQIANDQAAKVLAGTSELGVTAEEAAKEGETARHNKNTEAAARAEHELSAKKFAMEFGGDAVKGWAATIAQNPDAASSVPAALRTGVQQQFTKDTGLPFPKPLTGTAVDQERAARNTLDKIPRIQELLADPEVSSRIGPIMGRLGNAEQGVGEAAGLTPAAEQKAQELRTLMRYMVFGEGKAVLGGRLPKELMQALETSSPRVSMSPDTLKGAMAGVTEAANDALDNADKQRFGGQMRTREKRGINSGLPAGSGKVIDRATAQKFYVAAGSDPAKAQRMAEEKGWKVQ